MRPGWVFVLRKALGREQSWETREMEVAFKLGRGQLALGITPHSLHHPRCLANPQSEPIPGLTSMSRHPSLSPASSTCEPGLTHWT